MNPSKRIVLIAGMGTSPAVLTETVWALAHQAQPVVPDEIAVITTRSGKDALVQSVMSGAPSVWERLKAALRKEKIEIEGKLVFGGASIHVIPDEDGNEAGDLRTGDDNLRAADFMLRQIRQYSESPDTAILCSIAGGRKTMSALLFSCMTLLGREDDKVYHVLLPPEFEQGAEPPFYFPEPGVTYTVKATGRKYKADKVKSELFEVPFVRMRGWYQEKFKSIPPSYRTLVSKVQSVAPAAVAYPSLEIDVWSGLVKVDGVPAHLSPTCLAALILLAGGAGGSLHKRLLELHGCHGADRCDWFCKFREGSRFADENVPEDLNKVMSELRKKLSAAGFAAVESLVPQRGRAVSFPFRQIAWRNRDRMADVRGYLFPPDATEDRV